MLCSGGGLYLYPCGRHLRSTASQLATNRNMLSRLRDVHRRPVLLPMTPHAHGQMCRSSRSELTEELITAAMAKADARVCVGNPRCFALPDPVSAARETCTPKGRCRVGGTQGVIVGQGGRESWDVWLEVATGLVKLIRQADA